MTDPVAGRIADALATMRGLSDGYETGYEEGSRSEYASYRAWIEENLGLADSEHVERVVAFVRDLAQDRWLEDGAVGIAERARGVLDVAEEDAKENEA